jgi:hypothetical protein
LRSVDTERSSAIAPTAQVPGSRCHDAVTQASADAQMPAAGESLETITITGGGIRARNVEWVDTAGPSAAPASAEGGKLESITVGGVNYPGDAAWVDDSSLPDLPMIHSGGAD